jgi:hypothetical protein
MSSLNIVVREASKVNWNESLEGYDFSIFQIKEWLESIETKKTRPVFLDIVNGDETIAKISGIITRQTTQFGKVLYFYSGPALKKGANEEQYNNCLEAVIPYAKKHRCSMVLMDYMDSKQRTKPTSIHFKYQYTKEYIADLANDYKTHKPGSGLKQKLKKAAMADVIFKKDNAAELLEVLIKLQHTTKKVRLNKKRNDYNPFIFDCVNKESLLKLIHSGKAAFHYVIKNNDIHYISMDMEHNNKSYGLYNGADAYAYENGIPAWAITQSALKYMDEGFQYLNLGATAYYREDSIHLANFKQQLGGKPANVCIMKTDFLIFPYKLINPIINLGRKIPYNPITHFLRRLIS